MRLRGLRTAVLSAAIAACLLPAGAAAAGTPVFSSSFGPDGTDTTNFESPGPIAVDEGTHSVYVADELGTISKFDEDGTPTNFSGLGENTISGFSFFTGAGLFQIAVNSTSHNIYVTQFPESVKALQGNGEPAEFSALGSSEIAGFSEACGVAVDADGNIYVADRGVREVKIFKPNGEALTSFGTAPEPCNLAVDSEDTVYVTHNPFFFPGVEKFEPSELSITASTTYPPSGTVVSSASTFSLAVNPANDELFTDERLKFEEPPESQIARYEEDGTRVGEFAGPGEAGELGASEGIAVDGSTGKVYTTHTFIRFNENEEVIADKRQVEIFVPPPPNPPSIGASLFENVTASSADVQFEVNPELFSTRYCFQYVTQSQFEASGFAGASETAKANLGSSGSTSRRARAHLGGLAPDTAYRFRIVAENENGAITSPEPAPGFRTLALPPPGLPDGRAYEMVSPPQKLGEVFPPEPLRRLGSSCSVECLPGQNAQLMPMQSDPGGEAVVYVGQPFSSGLSGAPNEYLSRRTEGGWGTQSLSPLLTAEGNGFVAVSTDLARGVITQTSPVLSPQAPSSGGSGYANLYLRGANGSLTPLITAAAPPHRDPGTVGFNRFVVVFAGVNSGSAGVPALSHVIFAANDTLTAATSDAPAAPEVGPGECRSTQTGESCNLYEWVGGELRLVNVLPGNTEAVASVIGSGRLLAQAPGQEGPSVDHAISADGRRIFWSEKASGQVYVRIDGKETRKIEDPGKFLTASPDGSKVLLDDGCLYDLGTEACEDLSEGQGGFEGAAGASEDLARIYFVDTAALTGAEENADGEAPQAGAFNLYCHEEDDTRFIATLLGTDNEVGTTSVFGAWHPQAGARTAQASPDDGRYLAFMSKASLTGYDNEPKGGGGCGGLGLACLEVFEYDAVSAELTCVSCNPSGQQPLSESNLSLIKAGPAFPPLPQPSNLVPDGEGRLFFESQDTLSPRDSNGHIQDVYEWEPNGVGSCTRPDGCVYLISSGRSANDSMFLNATPSGNDAFFITREQLLPQDKDQRFDLYDARVGGGFPPLGTAPCGPEACKGQVAGPPAEPEAGSAVFSGPGNPRPACKRGFVRKHGKCVKKKAKHKKKGKAAKRSRGGAR